MEHPNIAKVFDAGATSTGRPYFVMEYVPGIPITAYCDKHCLAIRERLGLFMQVCEGVQHAHQKAIIHRDLKPFNVLVEELDQKPVPKIIDFGLAKARAVRLWLDIKLWQRWEPTKEKPDSTLSWRKEFLKEFAETDARKCPLGSLPVVVISSEPSAPESHLHTHDEAAPRLDFLSSNNIHVTATRSGHELHLYKPETVTARPECQLEE